MNLEECLDKIQDPRRKEGMRHNLHQMFSMILISGLCGHFGGRPVARFSKSNSLVFIEELKLKHKPPSHVSFSFFLNHVPQGELIEAFHSWTSSYVPLSHMENISGDGKALKSTKTDNQGKSFQAIVTLFAQESGLAHSIAEYRNDKKSEIHVIQFLIERLRDMGVTIFLDALHCQKKQ